MRKVPYPRTCDACTRVYSSRQSFSEHKKIGNCRMPTLFVDTTPISHWNTPDLPESIQADAENILRNANEPYPAFLALIYFNDVLPQNRVLKLRRPSKPFGFVKAIVDNKILILQSTFFYDQLVNVLEKCMKHYKDASPTPIDITERLLSFKQLTKWEQRTILSSVIASGSHDDPDDDEEDDDAQSAEEEVEEDEEQHIQPSATKPEVFYQRILEKRHGGRHMKTLTGVTDVTTPTMHIEIKQASLWTYGYRQLLGYNAMAPRKELRLYLFDAHELSDKIKKNVVSALNSKDAPPVSLYVLDAEGNEKVIYDPLGFV